MQQTARILALVGPTGAGKSALAMRWAKTHGGEIVACDALTVYRGFDIGTAKPTLADQDAVRHHLIDVADWTQAFDAARYVALADHAIKDIWSRNKVPIIVGGTGLYLRALRFGLADVGAKDEKLRRRYLLQESQEPGVIYRALVKVDKASAKNIGPRNLPRLLRALEICVSTGEPASVIRARHGFLRPRWPIDVKSLDVDDARLRFNIRARLERMLALGIIDETRNLLAQGIPVDCAPMRAVGYKEASQVIAGMLSVDQWLDEVFKRTWGYARRQRTWLRRERDVVALRQEDALDA